MNFPRQFSWITKSLSSLWVQIFDFFAMIISQNIFQFKISQQKFCFVVKMVTINRLLCELTLKTKWIIRMNQDNQISSLSCILKFVKKKVTAMKRLELWYYCYLKMLWTILLNHYSTMFVSVIENLESHEVEEFHFLGLESQGI